MDKLSAAPDQLVQSVARLIAKTRISVSTEKAMQSDLERLLTAASIPFAREHRLSDTDIPDFIVGDGVVLECKLRGARKILIFKQLERYAAHARVKALVLVSNVSMGLPEFINGKPLYHVSVSTAWM